MSFVLIIDLFSYYFLSSDTYEDLSKQSRIFGFLHLKRRNLYIKKKESRFKNK